MKGEDMSIHVTDFKWEKGINDARYIELLEKTLKNEQRVIALAMAKVRQLAKENQEIRDAVIDEFISRLEKHEQENWIDHQEYGITWSDIERIADEMRGAE